MGIGIKVTRVVVLAVLATVTVSILAYIEINALIETADRVNHAHDVLEHVEHVASLMKDAETGQRGFLLTGEERYLEPFNAAKRGIDQQIADAVEMTADDPQMQRRVEALRPLITAKFAELEETIVLRREEDGFARALEVVLTDRGKKVMDDLRAAIDEITTTEMDLLAESEAEAVESARLAVWVVGGVSAAAIVLLSLLGIFMIRDVTGTIRRAVDELTPLTQALLATTTEQAAGASEQSAAVAQTVATVDEVSQTSEQSREIADQVSEEARRTEEIGQAGSKAVDDTLDALVVAREQMESTSENILTLAEQTQAIGEIIATVNDIAEQTHLLALNAAIEASRAGEHGRGFSVVASEVKALADQSKKATSRVRQILGEIQNAASATVSVTQKGSQSMDEAVKTAEETGETIRKLIAAISSSATSAAQIAASSSQQAVGIKQVQESMTNIDSVVHQTLTATQQLEKAAQDLDNLSEVLATLLTGNKKTG